MSSRGQTVALIVAAGSGSRSGLDVPKQYVHVAGKAVLAHAIDHLAAHPGIDAVRVVIGPGQEALYKEAIGGRTLGPPIIGGEARRDSVRNGLDALVLEGTVDRVLIHDAARPFTPAAVIDRVLAALDSHDGAVPVLPVADTLVRGDALVGDTVDRTGLHRVQTPQAFRLNRVLAAHEAWPATDEATDDAQMVRRLGGTVALVTGDTRLEKLTYPEDFAAAEARLSRPRQPRTGMGFDVHAFEDGDGVWLGGIHIPHTHKLKGHSDADVALHALTDALLGTIGAGDIGDHFPPSDPQWKGAPSPLFLEHARDLVSGAGGRIEHVDLTIICEAPKIGPHRDAIRARIAELLRLSLQQVSVKATTTERLGFTGRGEGIAAQAIATVTLEATL